MGPRVLRPLAGLMISVWLPLGCGSRPLALGVAAEVPASGSDGAVPTAEAECLTRYQLSEIQYLVSLQRASHLQVLIELMIAKIPQEIHSTTLLKGTISCDVHSSENSMFQRHFVLSRPISHELSFYSPPQLILRAISRLTLYRMQERSKMDLAEGNFHRATRRLQNLATRLLAQGEIGLAKVVLDEVANIEKHNTISEEGEKRIKFGTRAIMLPESS